MPSRRLRFNLVEISQVKHLSRPAFTNTLWPDNPDNKVHGAYMGPTWGRQHPGGPHVGPMNFAIRE